MSEKVTPKTLSLKHLVRGPLIASPLAGKPPLLVLLHGVGSSEHDLFGLAPSLDPRLVIVSARGPLVHAQNGGAAWYPVTFTPDGIIADEGIAAQSRDKIVHFLGEAAEAYGADPRRIYLGGFSQGAIMSLYVVLTQPQAIAGAVLMSGRLIPAAWKERAPDELLRDLPVLAVHGLYDPVLPIASGREIRDKLSSLPLDFAYHEYPMAHEVSSESLTESAAWFSRRLSAPLSAGR
ncbi:MAG: alpha/beta hydrolase [Cytophagales bacterium]|nr:alpha/beta hydrolase [Armatimonadota bacterium]